MDVRVQKLQTGIRVLKATRILFGVGGVGFGMAAIAVAFLQAKEVGVPGAVGIAVIGLLFGFVLAAGVWIFVTRFMRSAQNFAVKLHGPRFEQELTGRTDYWDEVAAKAASLPEDSRSTTGLDLNIALTASVAVDDVEETLTFTHLFTQDDLRGNLDVVVAASPGRSPDSLTEALLRHMKLGFEGREKRLSPVAHQDNDPDGSFLVVLGYSIADLIGELDQPGPENWLGELGTVSGRVNVYWDNRLLGKIQLVVAD